jgi:glycogen operon protein
LVAFTARVLALRRQWLPLRATWYTGLADARGVHDLGWLRRGGQALGDWDWAQPESRVLGALIGAPGRSAPEGDRPLLLLFNAEPQDTDFQLPPGPWTCLLDSADDARIDTDTDTAATPALPHPSAHDGLHGSYALRARSVALLAGPFTANPRR